METNKKVSIVIPVYKAADTITRCVESLEKNTYKNLQIILVEDCSGDQTINICKKLANTYDNVLCIENDQIMEFHIQEIKGWIMQMGPI